MVYKFTCPGCSYYYIGKTDRCFIIRSKEHSDSKNSEILRHKKSSERFYNFNPLLILSFNNRELLPQIGLKVMPQFCIAHFYCAHLITYNFIHYTYSLKKSFCDSLCYFKTSLVTFVQRITLISMFSKKAYKIIARVRCVCSIFIYLYFTF